MVELGAKNLILLSRSAGSQANAKDFLDELKGRHCNIATRNCDIAEEANLARAVQDCAREMPPVRGVIQAAMVLRVSP